MCWWGDILSYYTVIAGLPVIWICGRAAGAVEKTPQNYNRLITAFSIFGMPTFDMTADNFLNNPDIDVFTFGRQPVAIDIITAIKGLTFAETYEQASDVDVDGVQVRLIHYNHLLQAKRAAGRPRDQNDLDNLQQIN